MSDKTQEQRYGLSEGEDFWWKMYKAIRALRLEVEPAIADGIEKIFNDLKSQYGSVIEKGKEEGCVCYTGFTNTCPYHGPVKEDIEFDALIVQFKQVKDDAINYVQSILNDPVQANKTIRQLIYNAYVAGRKA